MASPSQAPSPKERQQVDCPSAPYSASSGEDAYGEVHVILQDGRSIYWPKGDISRYAPAAVCQVTMRIKMLRKILKTQEIPPELRRELERLAMPLPYEAAWDSQCSTTVHNAIKRLGENIFSLMNADGDGRREPAPPRQ